MFVQVAHIDICKYVETNILQERYMPEYTQHRTSVSKVIAIKLFREHSGLIDAKIEEIVREIDPEQHDKEDVGIECDDIAKKIIGGKYDVYVRGELGELILARYDELEPRIRENLDKNLQDIVPSADYSPEDLLDIDSPVGDWSASDLLSSDDGDETIAAGVGGVRGEPDARRETKSKYDKLLQQSLQKSKDEDLFYERDSVDLDKEFGNKKIIDKATGRRRSGRRYNVVNIDKPAMVSSVNIDAESGILYPEFVDGADGIVQITISSHSMDDEELMWPIETRTFDIHTSGVPAGGETPDFYELVKKAQEGAKIANLSGALSRRRGRGASPYATEGGSIENESVDDDVNICDIARVISGGNNEKAKLLISEWRDKGFID